MKKSINFLLALFFSCSLFAQQINDANAIKVNTGNFNSINVSNAINVYLTQGNEDAVAISASETKFRDNIKVEVKGGTLYISYEKGLHLNSNKMKLKAYISFKNIEKLTASGACDIFILETLRADKLAINLSGATDLKGKMEVNNLSVDITGASDMKINGTATNAEIEASGASDFKGYDFVTENCNAKASGASSVQITVNKELNAQATGASDVHFKGDGVIRDIKTGGAGSVSKSKS